MPTYEYECKSCGYVFEAFQSMNDDPLKTCPQCGRDIRRLINGGSGVIFKGSGFYVTDKKSGTAAAPAGAASGGAKAEPKPAAPGGEPAASKPAEGTGGSSPKPAPAAETKAAG
jgi:putative FmdB family regulatory protein